MSERRTAYGLLATVLLLATVQHSALSRSVRSNAANLQVLTSSVHSTPLSCISYEMGMLNSRETECPPDGRLRMAGLCYSLRGDWRTAKTLLVRATACDPADTLAHYWLGVAHFNLYELDEAADEWREARAVGPVVALAREASAEGREAEALYLFEIALSMGREYPGMYGVLYREYARFLIDHHAFQDPAGMMEPLVRAAENNPWDVRLWIYISELLAGQGDLEAAEAWLKGASGYADRHNGLVHLALANLYWKWGRFQEALIECRLSLDRQPANPWAYITLGKIHYNQADYLGAIEAFERASDLGNPQVGFRAAIALGDAYLSMGDCERARQSYQRAVDAGTADLEPDYLDYARAQLLTMPCRQ